MSPFVLSAAAAPAAAESKDALSDLPLAEPHSILAQLDKEEVRLGEPFTYTIQIKGDPDDRYRVSDLAEFSSFELRDAATEWQSGPDGSVSTLRLSLQAFAIEEPTIPALTFVALGPAGPRRLVVPEQKLRVARSVKDPEAQPRDIRPPVPLYIESYAWIAWLASALGLVALGLVAWRAAKKWPKKERRGPPPEPPLDRALRELALLEEKELARHGRAKEHYFALSEIVRRWLGARYGFEALESTTEELCAELEKRSGPELDRAAFAKWMDDGDLIRYAKVDADSPAARAALKQGREFVVATKPPPPPKEPA